MLLVLGAVTLVTCCLQGTFRSLSEHGPKHSLSEQMLSFMCSMPVLIGQYSSLQSVLQREHPASWIWPRMNTDGEVCKGGTKE